MIDDNKLYGCLENVIWEENCHSKWPNLIFWCATLDLWFRRQQCRKSLNGIFTLHNFESFRLYKTENLKCLSMFVTLGLPSTTGSIFAINWPSRILFGNFPQLKFSIFMSRLLRSINFKPQFNEFFQPINVAMSSNFQIRFTAN